MNRLTDLGRFYSILEKLDASQQQGLKLGLYSGTSRLPLRGVYFFREPGELRSLCWISPHCSSRDTRRQRKRKVDLVATASSTSWYSGRQR